MTTDTTVRVDIVERGRALIAGPGFDGYVRTDAGPRTDTGRVSYVVVLSDDTTNGDREPLPPVTLALRKGFPASAESMARKLAAHYEIANPVITVDDETGTYRLPKG